MKHMKFLSAALLFLTISCAPPAPRFCVANCATYNTDGTCNTCNAGFSPFADGSCAAVAVAVANCDVYATSTTCDTCGCGFTPSTSGLTCCNDIAFCAEYSDANVCTACVSGYILSSGGTCVLP